MKTIFEEYGSIIIAAIVVAGLVAVLAILLTGDGVVAQTFRDLFTSFYENTVKKGGTDGGGAGGALQMLFNR